MTQKSIGPHFISAYVAHLMTSENNTLFAQDNVRKREHLMQQQIYNRCHITTAPNTTGKSSMTSIAHRGGWGPTRMPNAHKTTQSRLPEKEHSCGTTNALSKISGHAKGTITAATALGSQTSPGCDGKYRYWLSARQVLQSSFPSPEELIEQSVTGAAKGSAGQCY